MKRICYLLISVFLIFSLTACQSQEDLLFDELMRQVRDNPIPEELREDLIPEATAAPFVLPTPEPVFSPAPGDELSGQLTVKTCMWIGGDGESLHYLAQEFMQLHPNVVIDFDYNLGMAEINTLSRAEREMRIESFYAQVKAELASGESDYLLYDVRSRLNLSQLARGGFLTDLNEFFENDSEIDREDYFFDVLRAFEVDGKLASLPYSFLFDDIYLNRPILEEIGIDTDSLVGVSAEDVLAWYEKARETHDDLNLMFTSPGKEALFYYLERCRYIDLDNRIATFDSPEFINFLQRTQAVLNDDPDLDPDTEIGYASGGLLDGSLCYQVTGELPANLSADFPWDTDRAVSVMTHARPGFAVFENAFIPNLVTMQQPKEYAAGPFPIISSDGKLGVHSIEEFAMPSGLENKALAWEFMKYCIQEREQDMMDFSHLGRSIMYTNYIPLNKKTFQSAMKHVAEKGVQGTALGYSTFSPVDAQALTAKVEQIVSLPTVNTDLYSIDVEEFLNDFYAKGLTTAEQCAAKLQGRAEIWLNE